MSKILSGLLAVCIVASSFMLLVTDLTSYDADEEGAYVQHDIWGSGVTYGVFFFAEEYAKQTADLSGIRKNTILEKTDNGWLQRFEERISGEITSCGDISMLADDLLDMGNYSITGQRASVGGTLTHAWEFVNGEFAYTMYSTSDKTLELTSVLRLVAIRDSESADEWKYERHVLDFNGTSVKKWTFTEAFSIDGEHAQVEHMADVGKDPVVVTEQTVFGKRGVVIIELNESEAKVEIETGVVLELVRTNVRMTLVSTNIGI